MEGAFPESLLRQPYSESTPWESEYAHLEPARPEIVWPRTWGRAVEVAERVPKAPQSGAAHALRMALSWSAELESGGISRAEIARREGISRARVTQILRLAALPEERQRELLAGTVVSSIRGALAEVGST